MHIKAIQIKEQLLGQEDYEVALSVGHLASLYNYDMNQYEDAERLYLRSIAIGQSVDRIPKGPIQIYRFGLLNNSISYIPLSHVCFSSLLFVT